MPLPSMDKDHVRRRRNGDNGSEHGAGGTSFSAKYFGIILLLIGTVCAGQFLLLHRQVELSHDSEDLPTRTGLFCTTLVFMRQTSQP